MKIAINPSWMQSTGWRVKFVSHGHYARIKEANQNQSLVVLLELYCSTIENNNNNNHELGWRKEERTHKEGERRGYKCRFLKVYWSCETDSYNLVVPFFNSPFEFMFQFLVIGFKQSSSSCFQSLRFYVINPRTCFMFFLMGYGCEKYCLNTHICDYWWVRIG